MPINKPAEDEVRTKAAKKATVLRVVRYMGACKGRIAFVVFLMLASAAISVTYPALIENAVDVQVASRSVRGLAGVVLFGLALAAVRAVCNIVRVRIMADISNSIVLKVRSEAYAHLQTLSLHYFDTRPTGKILSRIIGDITSLKYMLRSMVTNLVPNLFFFATITVVMLVRNPLFAGAVFTAIPLMVAGVFLIFRKAFGHWRDFRQKQSNVNAYAHETFSGIRVVQSFGAQDQMMGKFASIATQTTDAFASAVRRADCNSLVMAVSQGLGYFFLYYFAVRTNAPVGSLLAYTTYIGLFWQPLRQMAAMYNQLGNQIAGAERVFEILDTEPLAPPAHDPVPLDSPKGSVELEDVSFAYPDEPQTRVLSHVSFSASPGQTIALVGPTGAGKTTIANLVARFYDPTEGRVLLDGLDLRTIRADDMRRAVGVMTQDSYLFSGTILENLVYGKPDATFQEVEAACEAIGVHEIIMATEKGYDTPVTDQSLSQGQRQLLALARVLLCNPAVLILDEATSAIDTRTELMVQRGIRLLTEGRTGLVVAHRLSTIKNADRILVIDNKGIEESGSHDALMAQGGKYRQLYEAQFDI